MSPDDAATDRGASMTRMFITQYKCTTCDFTADRPSAFFAHYRDVHDTEIIVTFPKDDPADSARPEAQG